MARRVQGVGFRLPRPLTSPDADVWLNAAKTLRLRLGRSKVPSGFVNIQSSQNRAPMERPEAVNSAAEGERDIGAFVDVGFTAGAAAIFAISSVKG